MKCRICDATLSEVHFNSDHNDIEPCSHCLLVINETLEGFKDTPAAPEDAWAEEPLLPLFYKENE